MSKLLRTVRKTSAALVTAALVAAVAAPGLAQPAPRAPALGDRAFITGLLQESRGQIALAGLAARRAAGMRTASAAKQTIAEWGALRSRLVPIAYAQGDPVRGTLDRRQLRALDQLGRTPARLFDRAYLDDAERGDAMALAQIKLERNTSDARIQLFLTFAQPLVTSYEQMTSDDSHNALWHV